LRDAATALTGTVTENWDDPLDRAAGCAAGTGGAVGRPGRYPACPAAGHARPGPAAGRLSAGCPYLGRSRAGGMAACPAGQRSHARRLRTALPGAGRIGSHSHHR
jgi:hypothetical protein